MKKTNLFIMNTLIIMVSSLLIKIITSVFDIYLANRIGAEAIGVYSLIMSIYMFCVTVATSGVNLATTKVISEEIEKDNKHSIPKVIRISFIYSLCFGIFSGCILAIFARHICSSWLVDKISPSVLYILAVSLPFVSLTAAINGYFLASRKVIKTSSMQIAGGLFRILIIYTFLSHINENNITMVATLLVLSSTVTEIISFFILYYLFRKDKKKFNSIENTKDQSLIKRILKISIPIAITSYIRSGLNTFKHILIPLRLKLSGMSYEKAISNYGIITGMALPIIMFPIVIVYSYSSLLIPEFSRLSVEFNKEKMNKTISKLFKVTLYFSTCVTGILMCFGKEIGNLIYSTKDVGWYIKIIAPLITLMYLDNVVDNILKGLGKQVSVMLCNILDLVISVSFIYFLLPIFSTNGYIIVLYISEILNYSISVITLFRTTNLKFKYFDWVLLPILCIFISLFLTSIIPMHLSNLALTLVIKIVICILMYLTLLKIKEKITII